MEKSDILIVDDRLENILVLEEILDSPDLNIISSTSGNEALGLVLRHDFALVLMDVQMPGMDGFETAELMRGSKKTRHIPIIFVTAISKEKRNIFKGYEAGAVDYLFKPIDPEILKSKVHIFLDLHRQKKKLERMTRELGQTVSELEATKAKLENAKDDAERLVRIRTAELSESEEKYRGIFENAVEGIFQVTYDGRLTNANPALAHILGYGSKEEILAQVTDLKEQIYANPDDRDEYLRLISETGKISGFEVRVLHKKGHTIWVSINARSVCNENGDVLFMEGMLEDITVRKEKEKAEREREIAEAANKKIMESIQYAKVIQGSLLPNINDVKYFLPDSFFLWMPRDIVGGDIFHAECFNDGIVVAVLDCTGHGVPGAFMSMLAFSGLRRIVRTENCHDPAKILQWLNYIIKTSLHQDTEFALSDDGLDAAVCFAPHEKGTLTFAGANLPLYYTRNDGIHVIKGDRQSIGYKKSDLSFKYANHTLDIEKGMSFYLASDGFPDQLGGDRDRRFGTRRFRELLLTCSGASYDERSDILLDAFNEYKGKNEAIDDVTVIGFGFDTKGGIDRRHGYPDRRESFIERRRRNRVSSQT